MTNFEKVQRDILDARESAQLVSAGAGSGKTTVMIEKIANLILDGVPIDSILVVTFTVLAGQEMKDRLEKKLKQELDTAEDKAKILDILERLKTASIDTIDGFSSKMIRKYFYELNLSPNIEIISDNTRDYFLSRAMRTTFNKFSNDVEKLNVLIDIFGGNRRNLDNVEELILDSYYNLMNIENYEEFLLSARREYENSIKSENVVNAYINKKIRAVILSIRDNYSSLDQTVRSTIDTFILDLNKFSTKLNLKANLNILYNLSIPSFTAKEIKENLALAEIDDAISSLSDLRENLRANGIDENFDEKNEKILIYFDYFIEILAEFIKNYNNLKEKNNLLDFNDLNRLMLKLLKNDRVKTELNTKYKYIFVDEYQDVNPLQDKLINALAGSDTKVFVVGDVKQSIYGFRGASPQGFIDKYSQYKNDTDSGRAFDMNINFRSNPKVLEFINEIFSNIMKSDSADIPYYPDNVIEPKRTDIVDDKVKICLVKDENSEEIAQGIYSVESDINDRIHADSKLKEATLVLKIITDLIGQDIYDAKEKVIRKIKYSDIAILSRSEKDETMRILIELLKSNAVPLNVTNKLDIAKNECIRLILSILKCVNNTADNVDYLATIFALTDIDIDQLIEIHTEDDLYLSLLAHSENESVATLNKILENIRNASFTMTNSGLIRYILNDCRLKYYILAKENGAREIDLLDEFINKLTAIEDSLNIAEFIEVVESNVSRAGDFQSSDNENSVTIQTIHKSKGLEYPIVILYNASKMFSYLRENDSINFNDSIGFGVDYFDMTERTKRTALVKYAINLLNMEKGYKEEMRLLYVALTRAQNKLYITGKYTDKIFTDIKNTSFMNMILSCYRDRISEGINEFHYCDIDFIDSLPEINLIRPALEIEIERADLGFVYQNQSKFSIPIKNTVTGLNSELSQKTSFSTKKWFNPYTQYSADDDRATIGTHYHSALENLDFLKEYQKNTDYEDVDYRKIKLAYDQLSPLMKDSVDVRKEADFMLYIPYNEIVPDSPVSDKVLVQGVVDLMIEYKDSITIVDYKFSTLDVEILKQKYQEQLALYKLAVERAYNKKVEHMYIYSIMTGELR